MVLLHKFMSMGLCLLALIRKVSFMGDAYMHAKMVLLMRSMTMGYGSQTGFNEVKKKLKR